AGSFSMMHRYRVLLESSGFSIIGITSFDACYPLHFAQDIFPSSIHSKILRQNFTVSEKNIQCPSWYVDFDVYQGAETLIGSLFRKSGRH
ncbi:MAG TPA: hypothetical protein PLY73_05795, partial [Candidatus Ozemobacteraceae bacterium]|nr:hypothetical protein [Candidatus Ozemobacteraceae bacterium]